MRIIPFPFPSCESLPQSHPIPRKTSIPPFRTFLPGVFASIAPLVFRTALAGYGDNADWGAGISSGVQ
jgi:hypothetical protein